MRTKPDAVLVQTKDLESETRGLNLWLAAVIAASEHIIVAEMMDWKDMRLA